jgi:hypothetical protein
MAKTMESELSTQHLEAQMKRSPQDFFSANLPVGQNQ